MLVVFSNNSRESLIFVLLEHTAHTIHSMYKHFCLSLRPFLHIIGKRLANVLCKIIENLDTTENGKSREETHGASNEAKGTLHGEGEVVLNLVVRGAPNTNQHNLEVVRQRQL